MTEEVTPPPRKRQGDRPKGEIEHGIRTGQPSTRQQLQPFCDAAAQDCRSFTAYQERLEAVGVEPVVQLGGAKLSGLSCQLDGVTMKGSDLGRAYSPAGLAKRGVPMSKTETLRQCASQSNGTRLARLATQLVDETRQTLAEIERRSRAQGETFNRQLSESAKSWKDAAAEA